MSRITQKKTNALALDLSAPISKRTAGQQDGHTNRRADGRVEGRREGRTELWTDGQTGGLQPRPKSWLAGLRAPSGCTLGANTPRPKPKQPTRRQHAVTKEHFSSLLHGGMCCQAAVNTQLTHS